MLTWLGRNRPLAVVRILQGRVSKPKVSVSVAFLVLHVYSRFLLDPSSLPPSGSSQTSPALLPGSLSFQFLMQPTESSQCCQCVHKYRAICRSTGHPPAATLPEKNNSPFPSLPIVSHPGVMTGLILHRSCAGNTAVLRP